MTDYARKKMQYLIADVQRGTVSNIHIGRDMAEPESLLKLADAIQQQGNIYSFSMTWNDAADSAFGAVLDALATNKNLHHIRLDGCPIGDKHAERLGNILSSNPGLRELSLQKAALGASAMSALSALGAQQQLRKLDISGNPLGNAGVSAVVQYLPALSSLREIELRDCGMNDDGILPLAQALQNSPDTLVRCACDGNALSPQAGETLLRAMQQGKHRNLYHPPLSNHPPLVEYCASNQARIHDACDLLERCVRDDLRFDDLLSCELAAIHHFQPALDTLLPNDSIQRYQDFLSHDLPALPPVESLTWESLCKPDMRGFCALDNPQAWQEFPRILQQLAKQGSPVTKAQLAMPNHNGESLLTLGMVFAPDVVLPALNAHGITLRQDDMVTPDGNATPLLKMLTVTQQVGTLFTPKNWQGAEVSDIRKTIDSLPPDARTQVNNLHSLVLELSRQETPQAKRGR